MSSEAKEWTWGQARRWQAAIPAGVAVLLVLLAVVPLHIGPRSIWAPKREGQQPTEVLLLRTNGVPLRAGDSVRPGERLMLGGVNLGDEALTALVFAVDSQGQLAWMLPQRRNLANVDYANSDIKPVATPHFFKSLAVPTASAGRLTIFTVVAETPLGTDRVDALAPQDRTADALRDRFQDALVFQLDLNLGA